MEILISYEHRAEEMERIPIAALAEAVLAAEGRPERTELSIAFVDAATIADLNERYRGKAGPTDVLSFECDTAIDEAPPIPLEEAPVLELGDIIIAPDIAEEHARAFGQTLAEEIELLTVHGILHLCGYDHEEEADARIMEAREEELLSAWREGGLR